jgi:hypothetical protein
MLLEEHLEDHKIWEKEVLKKLLNFCKKSPTLISISTGMQEGVSGIFITHVNSNRKYFFSWNYDLQPRDFIHEIKEVLVQNHYPRLVEIVYDKKELTPRDMAIALEKGKRISKVKKVELKEIGRRLYIVASVLLWKEIFILQLAESSFDTDKIGTKYRYKYNGSSVIYLKKYRNNSFGTVEKASEEFFNNALFVDELQEPKYLQENE